MDTVHVIQQVEAALAAAKKLSKTARSYVNACKLKREMPGTLNHLIMNTMGQSRDHDIMEELDLSRKRIDWVIGRCDIIIEPNHGGSSTDLKDLIIKVWTETSGRELLGGNPGKLTEAQLREKYPQFYGREDELFEVVNESPTS